MTAATVGRGEVSGVARASTVSLTGAISNAVLGLALTVLVSRALGPTGAGVFALLMAAYRTTSVAGRLGVDSALVRTLPRLKALGRTGEVRPVVRSALLGTAAVMVAVSAVAWWAAPALSRTVLDPASISLIRTFALFMPVATVSYIALAATRGLGSIVPLVLVQNVLKPGVRLVAIAVVIAAGGSLVAVSITWVVLTICGGIAAAYALFRVLRRLPATTASAPGISELWTFAIPRSGAQLCEIAGLHAGVVLAGVVATAGDAGVYNAVLKVALSGTLVMQALRLAVAPRLSHLLTIGDDAAVRQLHHACTAWTVLGSWPFYLTLLAWPVWTMSLFGDGFSDGATALSLLAVVMLFNTGTGNVGTVLLMHGRSGANLVIAVASLAVQIVGTLLLAPFIGVFAVALAKAASVVVENAAMMALVRRAGITTAARPVVLAAVLSVACFGAPALALRLLVGPPDPLTAIALLSLVTVVFASAVWRWRDDLACTELLALVKAKVRR